MDAERHDPKPIPSEDLASVPGPRRTARRARPDARQRLIKTLRTFFAAGANASEAADRLFLHRNSMPTRLERIGEAYGLDLREPGAALALQLGLLSLQRGEKNEDKHP